METINIRYGQSLNLAVTSDDEEAVEATLYVGNPGENPVITKAVTLEEGVAQIVLEPEDTRIPLGEYRYQINVEHSDGQIEKYPEPDDCGEDGLPVFEVHEALDETEVVS